MALVLSPWFGRAGSGRRTRRFGFGSPSLFTDLIILKVPLQRLAYVPVSNRAMSNARVIQWAETAEEHIFKLRLPGLKKEDMHIQIEDDRTLYISYSNQPKEDANEGEGAATSQDNEQQSSSCSFMRKFKLPENADLEQIKADITNEMLTVSVPKRKKSTKVRNIDVSEAEAAPAAATSEHATPSNPPHRDKVGDELKQPSTSTSAKPSSE